MFSKYHTITVIIAVYHFLHSHFTFPYAKCLFALEIVPNYCSGSVTLQKNIFDSITHDIYFISQSNEWKRCASDVPDISRYPNKIDLYQRLTCWILQTVARSDSLQFNCSFWIQLEIHHYLLYTKRTPNIQQNLNYCIWWIQPNKADFARFCEILYIIGILKFVQKK